MDIPPPSFIPALVALPFIVATFLLALRTSPPGREHPVLIISSLSAGLFFFAFSYFLFVKLGPSAALASIALGCLSLHLAMWLGRGQDKENISEVIPAPLDPDLLNFDDIDWDGFDRTRRNWAERETAPSRA